MNDLLVNKNSRFLIFVGIHYPGQFLQEIGEKTAAPISKTYAQLYLDTKGIEFLKRRNSHGTAGKIGDGSIIIPKYGRIKNIVIDTCLAHKKPV